MTVRDVPRLLNAPSAHHCTRRKGLGGDYVQGERELHVGVKLHIDLVETNGLHRLRKLHRALFQLNTGEPLDPLDYVGNRDRPIELAFVTRRCRDYDTTADKLARDRLGIILRLLLSNDSGLPNRLGSLESGPRSPFMAFFRGSR